MARESIESKVLRGVYPSKEDLFQYYIVNNNSQTDTAKHFGLNRANIQTLCEHWDIYKSQDQIAEINAKKTRINTRSISYKIATHQYPSKEEFEDYYFKQNNSRENVAKYFNITENAANSLIEYYGLHKSQSDILNTRKKTCISKFGCESNLQTEECKEKIKNTCLEKYGVEHISQADIIKKKTKETFIKRYGVEHVLQNEEVKQRLHDTIKERYGVDWACQREECKNTSHGQNSQPNSEFIEKLESLNIDFVREFPLQSYNYDFKIDNILVEIDPWFTHQSTIDSKFGKKPKNYHHDKTQVSTKNGYHCIHIFDWDDQDKIIRTFLINKEKIYARKCIIKNVTKDEEIKFLNSNHLQGYISSDICIGLYYNDELVQLMSFGKPRYNHNYEYELLRLCSSKQVIGGSNKIFNYFIETYKPKGVISYCDLSKFNGEVYTKLGFKLLRKSIGKHWYSPKLKKHITDNLLRQQGFDRLLGNIFGKYGKGSSNEELMLKNGFIEVYDAGQATYIFYK